MNKITQREYNDVKNKTVTVKSFKDGKRTLTYSNLSYKQAIDHLIEKTNKNEYCQVFMGEVL